MPRPRTPVERAADRATNHHADHDLSWVEHGSTTYTVHGIQADGRIIISDTADDLDTHEAYLWCETCGERCTDSVGIVSDDLHITTTWQD